MKKCRMRCVTNPNELWRRAPRGQVQSRRVSVAAAATAPAAVVVVAPVNHACHPKSAHVAVSGWQQHCLLSKADRASSSRVDGEAAFMCWHPV